MEKLLTRNIASLTEFREPGKVLAKSGNEPTAILNRNEVVAYLVPLINQLTFIPNKELWSQCRRPTVNYGSHRGIASLTRSMNCLRA